MLSSLTYCYFLGLIVDALAFLYGWNVQSFISSYSLSRFLSSAFRFTSSIFYKP